MGIFRAYDIRGIYPKDLNEKIALKIGKAFGTYNPGKIVVGMDTRLSSPSLKKALIKGLKSTSAKVIDIGIVTTPMVMFATRHLKCDGGIMVSASHNPKQYNGFKLFRKNGIPISYESGIKEVQKIFGREKFKKGKGTLVKEDITDEYLHFLLNKIDLKPPINLKVVVDAGNGPAGIITPRVLKELGITVYELYCKPDGRFPNHEPNPSKPENLVDIKKKVIKENANIGFAYDGDGDRVAVIDDNGNVVYVGVVFSILIENILSKKPGSKIVYTPLDSQAIEDVIKRHGGVPLVCRVGHTFITQKMLKEDASLAGEISGHYYFKEIYGADDALFASLKLIESLVKSGKDFDDYAKSLPKYYSEVSEALRVPIKESEKFKFIEKLKKEFKKKEYKISTIDGVKVFLKDGWALFRPSNTEAVISMSYEAKTKKGLERMKKFVNKIKKKIPR